MYPSPHNESVERRNIWSDYGRLFIIMDVSRRHKSKLTLASEQKLRDLYSAALQEAESCLAGSEAPKCKYEDMKDDIIAWECGKLQDGFGDKMYSGSQTHPEGVQTYVIYVRHGGMAKVKWKIQRSDLTERHVVQYVKFNFVMKPEAGLQATEGQEAGADAGNEADAGSGRRSFFSVVLNEA